MQEEGSAVQTLGQKGAVQEQTTTRIAIKNTDTNSNLNNSNAFTPVVKNKDIEYFVPGPNQESDRRASAEITE